MIIPFYLYVIGYLIGSLPIGFIIARLKGIGDMRRLGSGSTGATNVARVLGTKYFFLVFALDFLKTYLYLFLMYNFKFTVAQLMPVAFMLQLGNILSIFLQFKGGKGMATTAGILAFFDPWLAFMLLGKWLAMFMLSRTVGIASVFCAAFLLVFAIMSSTPFNIFYGVLAVNLLIAHKDNIWNQIVVPCIRLRRGGV